MLSVLLVWCPSLCDRAMNRLTHQAFLELRLWILIQVTCAVLPVQKRIFPRLQSQNSCVITKMTARWCTLYKQLVFFYKRLSYFAVVVVATPLAWVWFFLAGNFDDHIIITPKLIFDCHIRVWLQVSPKFPRVPLGLGGWRLGYEERRCWSNCPCN